jgi:hypothetical protein
MVFMAVSLSDAYRLVDVPHRVSLRIVDAHGNQDPTLSWALSALRAQSGSLGRAVASTFVKFLNVVASNYPEPARRFTLSVPSCRKVMDEYLKSVGAGIKTNRGSQWVGPAAGSHAAVARALSAVCAVTRLLAEPRFGGNDPSRVDPQNSRLGRREHRSRRWQDDTDRWLRIRKDSGIAPRDVDPKVFERWMKGLIRVGADQAIILSHELARHAGNRFCQSKAITLHDILVLSPQPGYIPAVNKGSRGERFLTLVVTRSLWDRLLSYVDGERRQRGGRSLAELRRMAADRRQRNKLRGMPLFTRRGEEGLTYDRLYRKSRAAAEEMDLFIRDAAYRNTGIKRYVTFHLLRHEYVHSRLDSIESTDRKLWPAERARLAHYMGWSDGEAMLDWYSAHHSRKSALAAAAEFTDRLDRGEEMFRPHAAIDAAERGVPARYLVRGEPTLASRYAGS